MEIYTMNTTTTKAQEIRAKHVELSRLTLAQGYQDYLDKIVILGYVYVWSLRDQELYRKQFEMDGFIVEEYPSEERDGIDLRIS